MAGKSCQLGAEMVKNASSTMKWSTASCHFGVELASTHGNSKIRWKGHGDEIEVEGAA